MKDLIADLDAKRERLNRKAEEYRKKRDLLNTDTKKWAKERDKLNDKVKKLNKQAATHREARDEYNQEVQSAKKDRDVLNKEYSDLHAQLEAIKKERLPKDGENVDRLKKDLRKLEFRQMTSVLSADKERDLVDQMNTIQAKIKEREDLFEKNSEVQGLVTNEKQVKAKAEDAHKKVSELADKAQREHDSMVALYEESDGLRKEADGFQEKFIKSKMAADEEHRLHIKYIRQIHDYDKIIAGLKQRAASASKSRSDESVKNEAEDIYNRFKSGEKLSTEDLMTLQKAGYL